MLLLGLMQKTLNKYIKIAQLWQQFKVMFIDDCRYGSAVTYESNEICQEVSDVYWEQLVRRKEVVLEIEIKL